MKNTNEEILNKIKEYMDTYAEVWCFSGNVLVAKEGQVLFEKAYGYANLEHNVGNTIATKFNVASITKSFTAMAIMMLHEKGLLNIQDSIRKYLPDYPEFDEKITIHHLLSHTSGIKNYNEIEGFFERLKKLYFTQEEFIALFKDYPLDFEPGEKFNYTNSGYYLLGVIIQRVSGKSYDDFIEENILKPLNMKDSAIYNEKNIVNNRANGYELDGDKLINDSYSEWSKFATTGGLTSTVEDILKWDNALYSDTLVSNKTLEKIFTDYSDGYGYGWSIDEKFDSKRIGHNGAHNGYISQLYRYPEEKICIILLCNHRFINVWDICDNLSAIAFGNNVNLPKRLDNIEIDTKLYSEYVGEYDDPDDEGFVFTVSYENNTMYLKFGSDSKFEIYPISETKFNHILIDEQYEFVENGLKIWGTVFPKINK